MRYLDFCFNDHEIIKKKLLIVFGNKLKPIPVLYQDQIVSVFLSSLFVLITRFVCYGDLL